MGCFIRGSFPQSPFMFVCSFVPSVLSLLDEEELLATESVHTELWRVDMCNIARLSICESGQECYNEGSGGWRIRGAMLKQAQVPGCVAVVLRWIYLSASRVPPIFLRFRQRW